jgi:hypothetical protein
MEGAPGIAGLLPFWILIAGALLVGASSWLDPSVRRAERTRSDLRDDETRTPTGRYGPNDVDPRT